MPALKISGQLRLIMPREDRFCLCHIGPLRKPFAPVTVIDIYRMKLRQIKRDYACFCLHALRLLSS